MELIKLTFNYGEAITETVLSLLKGKSLYGDYALGDKVTWVKIAEYDKTETINGKSCINISVVPLIDRDEEKFLSEYKQFDIIDDCWIKK